MSKKYYLAYGSNLNVRQMAIRCPGARAVGTAVIWDHRLAFHGSKTGAYLTIEPRKGQRVPVGVWEITEANEAALDRYEGFPSFYRKETRQVQLRDFSGETRAVDAIVYIMVEDRPVGIPSWHYVDVCMEGYEDFRFDPRLLELAVRRAWREVMSA